ncbi:MAG: adenosylhomocysteinase [Candidatus Omnitrophica bacterium]|nr:adenosylhomocysteinase [Candidatus Omnitrophota bacterium]
MVKGDVRNPSLAAFGDKRIEWAAKEMPVLLLIRKRFVKEKPLQGLRIGCCLHITTETANLLLTLKAGGAEVRACASNPLSTQDDVAASLAYHAHIPTFAVCGESSSRYYAHIRSVLAFKPHMTMDDGADLISTVHKEKRSLVQGMLGGTEETTTGVVRLKSLERKHLLLYPVIAVNEADTKHLFDNRYGTGQSTIDGILRATNLLLAGKTVVLSGYGWCGRGVASRARGMGANVVVTEVHPVRALEAVMDGYRVMPMRQAASLGDLFVTLTGDIHVIRKEHFLLMKEGAIVCNAGHFNVELDLEGLRKMSRKRRLLKEFVEEYTLRNGKKIHLLGEGRLVNLVCGDGHPASVMDMSFANQALACEYLKKHARTLGKKVYGVPKAIDENIARLKLKSLGIGIDTLTPEQKTYLSSWESGT